jgi:hypothetical protein
MTGFEREFRLSVDAPEPVELSLEGLDGLEVTVPADATFRQRVYLTSAARSGASDGALTDLDLVLEDTGTAQVVREATVFHGTGE